MEKRCPKCDGSGDIKCKKCGGIGWFGDPNDNKSTFAEAYANRTVCSECVGDGKVYCPKCDGHGTIDDGK
jgi:DnaJ-class molecular chaperone